MKHFVFTADVKPDQYVYYANPPRNFLTNNYILIFTEPHRTVFVFRTTSQKASDMKTSFLSKLDKAKEIIKNTKSDAENLLNEIINNHIGGDISLLMLIEKNNNIQIKGNFPDDFLMKIELDKFYLIAGFGEIIESGNKLKILINLILRRD